jgi:hypothetical protein
MKQLSEPLSLNGGEANYGTSGQATTTTTLSKRNRNPVTKQLSAFISPRDMTHEAHSISDAGFSVLTLFAIILIVGFGLFTRYGIY